MGEEDVSLTDAMGQLGVEQANRQQVQEQNTPQQQYTLPQQ